MIGLRWTYFPPSHAGHPGRDGSPIEMDGPKWLAAWLAGLCSQYPAQVAVDSTTKGASGSWSPAVFRGNRRANANVLEVWALCFDFDEPSEAWPPNMQWQALRTLQPYTWHIAPHIWHCTWSARPGAHRGRLIVPLAEPISGELCRQVLRRMTRELGADTSCTDPARAFYLPQGDKCETVQLVNADAPLYRVEDIAKDCPAVPPAHAQSLAPPTYAGNGQSFATRAERVALAKSLGATIGETTARDVRCPLCRRPTLWWWLDAHKQTRAHCAHVGKSCGATFGLWEL